MTEIKLFSVFSTLKSEAHLKIEGGRKPTENSFTHFANKHGGRNTESIVATTTAIFSYLSIPNKEQKAEISTTFFNTRILLRLHR